MMIKGYYIHDTLYYKNKLVYPGVEEKIKSQIGVLNNIYKIQELELIPDKSIFRKIVKRLPLGKNGYNYIELQKEIKEPKFLYLRKPNIDRELLYFLNLIKKRYPMCKIVMEIPTYPYDREMINRRTFFKMFPIYFTEIWNRKKLWKYVDRVATYSKDKEIWNIKTIPIKNGINVKQIPLICRNEKESEDVINIVSVATMQRQHGYERLIYGMRDYYHSNPNRKVVYHVVGNGPDKEKYQELVKKFNLNEYIKFYGMLSGEKLDHIYNKADIGVEVLGLHRNGIQLSSSLKSREYLARGLPFITSAVVDVLQKEKFPYVLKLEADESPVNINNVVKFYDSIYKHTNKNDVSQKIRKFALENCDMEVTMKPVLEFLQEKN